jgi:hypothetical protein
LQGCLQLDHKSQPFLSGIPANLYLENLFSLSIFQDRLLRKTGDNQAAL